MHLALILLCIFGGELQQSVFATAERRELKQNNSTSFAICWLVSDPSHRNSDCCLQVAVYPSSYILLLFPFAAAAALVSSSVVPPCCCRWLLSSNVCVKMIIGYYIFPFYSRIKCLTSVFALYISFYRSFL